MDGATLDSKEVDANLRRLREAGPARFEGALREIAEAILGEAKRRDRMPRKTGALSESDFVEIEGTPGKRFARLGFSIRYAAPVHERHPSMPKFLLRALTEDGPRITRVTLKRVFDAMGRQL